MTRLLARLGTLFPLGTLFSISRLFSLIAGLCLLAGMSACMDREGPATQAASARNFVDPVPDGDEQAMRIDQPFIGSRLNEAGAVSDSQAVSLFSFDTALDPVLNPDLHPTTEILASVMPLQRRGLVQALNTAHDETASAEYTVVARNDSLFAVDHENGTYRGLVHFAESVCAIKPKKIVDRQQNGTEITYRVLHDLEFYVMTSEGDGTERDCSNPDFIKRYYRLALNFRFDAYDSDPGHSNDLISVAEAEYNAELVFGWNDAEATPSNPNQILDYGFLGYDSTARELVFFDRHRERDWSQPRRLERFDVGTTEGALLPETWFKVRNLPHYQVLVELGRDVFIVDAGQAFFNPSASEIGTILSDRVYQKTAEAGNTYARELNVVHNDTDVLILDADRLYRYTYTPTSVPPSANTYTVHDLPAIGHGTEKFESKHLFSQFDLRPCRAPFFDDLDECALVNFDQEANLSEWQFVTSCTPELGCTTVVDNTDYCTTQAEFILTQDGRNMCSVLHHTHLNELNNTANDAGFLGFLPYVSRYARAVELQMDEDSAFITARMNERDILLRYFYEVPLTAPKSSRERVLLGGRIAHAGLDVYLNEGNLFVTALNNPPPNPNVRTNECYANYLQIDCVDCSADDLRDGKCFDRFNEYRSMALFCSAQALAEGTCTDSQIKPINTLAVHDPDRDGKWLEVLDVSNGGVQTRTMSLMQSDSVSDEGVLSSPVIIAVDNLTGVADQNDMSGRISGSVESVLGRWNLDNNLSRLNIIEQEIVSSAPTYANAGVLFVDRTDHSYPDAEKAGDLHFVRKAEVLALPDFEQE